MGAVALARDLALDRAVALKFLKAVVSARFDVDRQFQQEARLLSRLSHSNVVTIYSFGEDDRGVRYIAMEYIEGNTLEPRVERDFLLPLPTTAHVVRQIGSALSEAHARGVIHRDIKPGNILLTSHGDDNHYVKVVDFGLAKASEVASEGMLESLASGTAENGLALGTPAYISPEQATGSRVDHRADIYGLAAVVMRLLTGSLVFPGLSAASELLLAHVTRPPKLLSELGSWRGFEPDSRLERVLSKGLAKKVGERYQSVGHFCSDVVDAIMELEGHAPKELFLDGGATVERGFTELDALNETMVGDAEAGPLDGPVVWSQTAVLVVILNGIWEQDDSLAAEDAIDVIATLAARLQHAVREAGGRSQGGLHDRFTAFFTSAAGVADAAENAVDAALRMRQAFNEISRDPTMPSGLRPSFRIVVDVGSVVSSRSATEGELTFGKTLVRARDQAQRLEPGEVAVTNAAHRYVRGMFRYDGAVRDDGLRTVATKKTGFRARDPEIAGHPIGLVGRSAEVSQLLAHADGLFQPGAGSRAIVLSGVGGVGKTRLVREMLRALDEREEVLWLEASRCLSGDEAGPYAPFAQALRERVRVVSSDDLSAIRSKSRAFIRQRLGVDEPAAQERLESVLVGLLGGQIQEDSVLGQAAQRGQFFDDMAVLYEAMANVQPLLMLLDDFQFASGAARDLLAFLAGRMRELPVLFMTLVRDEGRKATLNTLQREGLAVVDMQLAELDEQSMLALVEHQLELAREIPPGLVSRILDLSHGLPLVAEETVHDLIDNGVIDTQGEGWVFTQMSLGEIQLPDTVDALFEGRIQRLSPNQRRILEAAAVAGQRFWPAMLANILGDAWSPLDLEDLETKGFVKTLKTSYLAQESAYGFVQRAMREAAYKRVQPRDRKAIHLVVARWLESHSGTALFHLEGTIGSHYRQGHEYGKAFPHLVLAAHRAIGVTALEESVHYLEACLEMLELIPDPELSSDARGRARLKTVSDLVPQYLAIGELQKAVDSSEALGTLDFKDARDSQDRRDRIAIDRARALYLMGRFDESKDAYETVLAEEGANPSPANRLDASSGYAATLAKLGLFEAALEDLGSSIKRFEDSTETHASTALYVSRAYRTLGNCALESGQYDVAAVHLNRALEIASEANAPEQSLEALNSLAALRFFTGDLAGAVDQFRAALQVADQWDFTQHRTMLLQNLGEALWTQGNGAESREMLERSEALARYVGMDGILAESFRIRSEIELADERLQAAEAFALRAVSAADETGAPRFQASANLALARARQALEKAGQGTRDGAGAEALEAAAELFERAGQNAVAEDLRRELNPG